MCAKILCRFHAVSARRQHAALCLQRLPLGGRAGRDAPAASAADAAMGRGGSEGSDSSPDEPGRCRREAAGLGSTRFEPEFPEVKRKLKTRKLRGWGVYARGWVWQPLRGGSSCEHKMWMRMWLGK